MTPVPPNRGTRVAQEGRRWLRAGAGPGLRWRAQGRGGQGGAPGVRVRSGWRDGEQRPQLRARSGGRAWSPVPVRSRAGRPPLLVLLHAGAGCRCVRELPRRVLRRRGWELAPPSVLLHADAGCRSGRASSHVECSDGGLAACGRGHGRKVPWRGHELLGRRQDGIRRGGGNIYFFKKN